MRLAIVRWRIAASGGAEQAIIDTSRGLREKGVDVTLIAEEWGRPSAFEGDFIKLPASKGGRASRFRQFQAAVAEAVAAQPFDLVQSHERVLAADIFRAGDGVHAAWFDRLRRSRPWWRRIGMDWDAMHRLYMESERRMAQETDMVFVAISNLVAGELRDWLGLPERRIRVIENGVDLDRFKPATSDERGAARRALGVPADGPVACYVGSGFERKGAFELVRALALPQLCDVTLIMAGRDKAEKALAALVQRLGLTDRVHMLGGVADVRGLHRAADLFVLPTLYDPGPIAALEALAAGLPVVITPDTGAAEWVEGYAAGRVSAREPEALADAIHRVLADIEKARQGVLAFRPQLELSAAVDKWLALYGELA